MSVSGTQTRTRVKARAQDAHSLLGEFQIGEGRGQQVGGDRSRQREQVRSVFRAIISVNDVLGCLQGRHNGDLAGQYDCSPWSPKRLALTGGVILSIPVGKIRFEPV